ncbi:plasmid stability protein [Laspinema sp. A4]|uniref:FitA-like ribbon-helix-helix domain-containing protein n=1 Tax=Laspinema sp. D2d TaxID=2953686 RepID=UPI0021BBB059|nr:plasmid stability protein [Laspinema sp. D2d]MCT7986510.1 plasmid stability protein [Laspinema sp. D2d]
MTRQSQVTRKLNLSTAFNIKNIAAIMSNITIQNFDDDFKNRLQKRADYYGRSLEEEAKEIIRAVLKETPVEPLNLADAIGKRFADLGEFEIPAIPREPLREPPTFKN